MRLVFVVTMALVATTPSAAAPPAVLPHPPRFDAEGFPLPAEAVARCGSARFRFPNAWGGLVFTPDGTAVRITFSHAEPPLALDTKTGRPAGGDRGGLYIRHKLAGGRLTFHVTDPRSGRDVWTNALRLPVEDRWPWVAEGNRWVGITDHQTGYVIDAADGSIAWTYQAVPGDSLDTVAPSPDGRTAVTISLKMIQLHDLRSGGVLQARTRELVGMGVEHIAPRYCPRGKSVALVNTLMNYNGHLVELWDTTTGEVRKLPEIKAHSVGTEFTRDGKLLVVRDDDLHLLFVDVTSGKIVRRFDGPFAGDRIALSPDGSRVAVYAQSVQFYDALTGQLLPGSADTAGGVDRLRFAADGRTVIGEADDREYRWDAATGHETARRPALPYERYTLFPLPDGERVLRFDWREGFELLDPGAGRAIRQFRGAVTGQLRPALSADGSRVAVLTSSQPTTWDLVVWDVSSGEKVRQLVVPPHTAAVALSPTGDRVAAVVAAEPSAPGPPGGPPGGWEVRIWDLAFGEVRFRARVGADWVTGLRFSPDGSRLLLTRLNVSPDGAPRYPVLALMGLSDGQVVPIAPLPDSWSQPQFSPDGRILVFSSGNAVCLWEVASGRERHRFTHASDVSAVAVSPDGRTIAASSPDAPVYLWDVRGELAKYPAHPGRAQLDRYSATLASGDASAAFGAVRGLATAGADALAHLRAAVRIAPLSEAAVRQLVSQLGDPAFETRERATEALRAVVPLWEPVVRDAAAGTSSPEVARRLAAVYAGAGLLSGEPLRAARAVEAVEWVGTADAVRLLDEWTRDWAGTVPGREARAAADRLKRRPPAPAR
ncbi:MAG: hypothetical protein JWO38_3833 [Gemmataceae bacterium]|nr:hypothetical protein [Gemmataceae bacterium]